MYLTGEKYLWAKFKDDDTPDNIIEDGFRVKERRLEIGYWRKHPNLHSYIVNTFAGGIDECQEIQLSGENMLQIINAVTNNILPQTSGFFFGTSNGSKEEIQRDLAILTKALEWLKTPEVGVSRSIVYRASW